MHWKRQQQYIDAVIMAKVDITTEQLFTIRLETGIKYLELNFPDQADAYKETPMFWNWWQQIWLMRDKDTIENLTRQGITAKPCEKWYAHINEAQFFRYRPNRDVVEAMYATQDRQHLEMQNSIISQINAILQMEVCYA